MHVVVCYDISETRQRTRFARVLARVLTRVQRSTWEGTVDSPRLRVVLQAAERLIDHETDTVRVYPVCGRCREGVQLVGTAEVVGDDDEDLLL